MIKPKTAEEIELMRENGILVSRTLAEVGKTVAPGVTTLELNRVAETFIRDHGAIPSLPRLPPVFSVRSAAVRFPSFKMISR